MRCFSFLRGRLGLVATHEFAVADLDSSMDRGPRPIGSDALSFPERPKMLS
ncbi:hypothetical protein [Leptospira noguchii]|uniref:hypothetical protein n=1 Tax=Leptospira noguchii TaxID=28182 RepID=UPI0012FC3EDD|nr:hypothetical protein [Leptospira noguchii]